MQLIIADNLKDVEEENTRENYVLVSEWQEMTFLIGCGALLINIGQQGDIRRGSSVQTLKYPLFSIIYCPSLEGYCKTELVSWKNCYN